MSPDDGAPDGDSLAQTLREMWYDDMLVWSSISSQVSPDRQRKTDANSTSTYADANMLAWSSSSSQLSQGTERKKSYSLNTCCMPTCLAGKNCLPARSAKKSSW